MPPMMTKWKSRGISFCVWRAAKVAVFVCVTQVIAQEDVEKYCKAADELPVEDAATVRSMLQVQQIGLNIENHEEPVVIAEGPMMKTESHDVHKQCLEDIRQRTIQLFKPRIGVSQHVLLIDPAYHPNVGDNLLSYGELCLFHDLNLTHEECSILQSSRGRDCSPDIFQQNKVAVWHAGGNWGDLWPDIQIDRLASMEQLQEYGLRTISMPQSYYYKSKKEERKHAVRLNTLFGRGFNLSLSWRQQNSLNDASQRYPKVDNFLSPDVAFMIGPISNTEQFTAPYAKRVDILFLIRKDRESVLGDRKQMQATIESKLQSPSYSFALVDWDDRGMYYDRTRKFYPMRQVASSGLFDYNRRIASSVAMLASAKVVVTDRLHGSIFAFLMNKPHVYIDQVYKKITLTRLVAFADSTACHRKDVLKYTDAANIEDAIQKAVQFIEAQEAEGAEVKDSAEEIDSSSFAALLMTNKRNYRKTIRPLGRSMLTTCSVAEVVAMVIPRILERAFGKDRLGTLILISDVAVWYIASSVYLAASQELLSVSHGLVILIIPLVQVLSGALLLPLSAFGDAQSLARPSWQTISILAACGSANYFGSLFAFESLAHNSLAFVSNIRSMETFSTTCLMILFVGETMSNVQLMGIVLAVAGGVLAAYEPQGQPASEHTISGTTLAVAVLLIANCLYSLRNVLLSQASELGCVFKSKITTFAVSCSMALPPGCLLLAISFCLHPQPISVKSLSADPALLLVSSTNFVIYNLASFYVLMQVKPTTHVLLLTGKRVVTTLVACSLVRQFPSVIEAVGLTIVIIGVLAFESEKRKQGKEGQSSCDAAHNHALALDAECSATNVPTATRTEVLTAQRQNMVKQLLQFNPGLASLTFAITATCSGLAAYLYK